MTERRGATAPSVLCFLRKPDFLRSQRWLRAERFLEFTEGHAAARIGIRGRIVANEVHRAGIAARVRNAVRELSAGGASVTAQKEKPEGLRYRRLMKLTETGTVPVENDA